MTRQRLEDSLARLSGTELAALARRRAEAARENDSRMGELLGALLETVDEMTRRLDDDDD